MTYKQVTPEERYIISAMKRSGNSIADIANTIGKSRSSIYRELERNKRPKSINEYNPLRANERCNERRRKSRKKSWFTSAQWKIIDDKILDDWSPEQISSVLKKEGIMDISFETIYVHIWADMRAGGILYKRLRHSVKQRRKRYRSRDSRGVLGGKRSIDERPNGAINRSRKGHYEIDLVHGGLHTDCVLTLVDRMHRYLLILKLENKTKEEVARYLIPIIRKYHIDTITADNGTEWHGFRDIELQTGVKFYFAEPYHSWERGTNENTNGLIRQYLPKKMSMRSITQKDCDKIALKLNTRPRKILNYNSPEAAHFGISFLSHF